MRIRSSCSENSGSGASGESGLGMLRRSSTSSPQRLKSGRSFLGTINAMERRRFLESCVAVSGAAGIGALTHAWAATPPRLYERTRLVDRFGAPLKAGELAAETNYVFHYPFAGTPCFLLRLARPVTIGASLRREDGATYEWNGGVGPGRTVVA